MKLPWNLAVKLAISSFQNWDVVSTLAWKKLPLNLTKIILDTLAKDYEIVVVTGTNGKTLTTALTVGILKEAFGEIVTNPSGANMITGITSTFLTAKKAKSGKKIAVLEIDEASLPKITEYITPSLLFHKYFP